MAGRARKFIAQPHVIYKKSEIKSATGLNLRSAEWAVLTQINGEQSIQEIANTLAMTVKDVAHIMYNLYTHGVIDVSQVERKKHNYAETSFFETLEKVLMSIIGPVATFVIDDMIADMEMEKSKFPVERIAELIELISDEISDEKKKIAFQSDMLQYLKKKLI